KAGGTRGALLRARSAEPALEPAGPPQRRDRPPLGAPAGAPPRQARGRHAGELAGLDAVDHVQAGFERCEGGASQLLPLHLDTAADRLPVPRAGAGASWVPVGSRSQCACESFGHSRKEAVMTVTDGRTTGVRARRPLSLETIRWWLSALIAIAWWSL